MPPRRMSPAAIVLAKHGVSQKKIAEICGWTQQHVSRQLGCDYPYPQPALIEAVRKTAGADAAEELVEILGLVSA